MLLSTQLGCLGDVPHDNPLDPRSPQFRNEGRLTGRVTTFYPPRQPLPSVRIDVVPGFWGAMTDEQGQFSMPSLPAGDYLVRARRQGYAPDSAQVTVAPGRPAQIELNLDGLPVFSSATVRSAHISRWWPLDDLYMVVFEAQVSDPDGVADIDQVIVSSLSPSVPLSDTLLPGPQTGLFAISRSARDLPTRSVHELLGQALVFEATDRPGNTYRTDPVFLARVIEPVPDGLTAPDTLRAGQSIPLRWNQVVLPFSATYRVEMVRNQVGIPPTVVWTAADLIESQAVVTDSLPAGTYFWTVSVVDSFGDWSRSREAVIVITP